MAKTVVGNLVVQLTANTKRFKSNMRGASKDVKTFSNRLGVAAKGIAAFVIPAGIGIGLFKIAKAGESFNQAMRSSLAIMGDVSTVMREKMSKAAQDVAAVTKFSA